MQFQNDANRQALPPRERILLTAHDLFYRAGIRATGVDRLIAESSVTKTTFYRQFASKNDLVLAFLEFRHENWMAWFEARLAEHGGDVNALCPTLSEWFNSPDFRGCAFINSLGELGGALPDVVEITKRHKEEMSEAIERVLPDTPRRKQTALSLALAIDGAIIRAQFDESPDTALSLLSNLVLTATTPGVEPH
jgi:AcrR family transcriptional regulator